MYVCILFYFTIFSTKLMCYTKQPAASTDNLADTDKTKHSNTKTIEAMCFYTFC